MEFLTEKLDGLVTMLIEYSPKIIGAIAIFIIGMWIINQITAFVAKTLDRSDLSQDIKPFILSLVGVGLKVLLILSVAGIIGIETTSFVAVLAAAGFAIGMALQGSLGHFAAGIMILIFKPYKVGDLIEAQDNLGFVKEIQIINTIIQTFDDKTVIIPNGMAVGDIITNLSSVGHLRINLNAYMPYEEDYPKVEAIILKALEETPKVLTNPAPFVGIEEFESHSIRLSVWPYAKTEDYWDVYYDAYKNVKMALGKNNIRVSYSEGIELGKIGL